MEMTASSIKLNKAKQTLIHVNEVEMWVAHLTEVRNHCQVGAKKALETRKKNAENAKTTI